MKETNGQLLHQPNHCAGLMLHHCCSTFAAEAFAGLRRPSLSHSYFHTSTILRGTWRLSRQPALSASVPCTAMRMAESAVAAKPKVIIITGPTGVGKTKASIAVAKAVDGEIISADSVQVYKGLDVGSDKISMEERQGIPHHLLDVLEPTEEFSAGDFYKMARKSAAEILERGKTPVVVGGTGFYLRWFMYGRANTARSSPEGAAWVEEALEKAWSEAKGEKGVDELTPEDKWEVGIQLLAGMDPGAANKVRQERNNYYRLKRVLEIAHMSQGKTWAEQDIDESAPLDYDFRCFFLHRARLELFDRILERCEQMVQGGLLTESLHLLEMGIRPNSSCPSRAIGYRQAMQFLVDCAAQSEEVTGKQVQQLVLDIATATRHLVKNQMTWFRDDDYYKWIDVGTNSVDSVVGIILTQVAQQHHEGDCGTSGRLTKEDANLMKRYNPKLTKLVDDESLAPVLQEARSAVEKLKQYNSDGGSEEAPCKKLRVAE